MSSCLAWKVMKRAGSVKTFLPLLSLSLSIHVSSLESIFLEKPLLRAYLFHRQFSIYRQDVSTFIHLFYG